jgi:toxin-antitoxin system PIN domain toxin
VSHLLDVNVLVACAWQSHADHRRANRWLERTRSFATTAVTEMGFLHVSLSPAFGATFADAAEALQAIVAMRGHRFVRDDTRGRSLPAVTSSKDVTDAHLVRLAARHRLKLSTLDAALCTQPWAHGVAEHLT